MPVDPVAMLRPRRQIKGVSAVLLPFARTGDIDWPAFRRHLVRTVEAGLMPAVNMDTGYVHLLDDDCRLRVLQCPRDTLSGTPFIAGAFVGDRPGDCFERDAYLRQIEPIRRQGATPVIFQSFGLTGQDEA